MTTTASDMRDALAALYEAARTMCDPEHCMYDIRDRLPWRKLADKAQAVLRETCPRCAEPLWHGIASTWCPRCTNDRGERGRE